MEIQYQTNFFNEEFTRPRFNFRPLSCDSSSTMSSCSTPSTPTSPGGYDIVPITPEDAERTLEHLRSFFFRDEPLNVEQKLLEKEDDTCPELEEYSVKSIKDGVSLMAVAPNGQIVGVCINGIIKKDEPEEEEEECENQKFGRILKLLNTVDREVDTFGQFPDVDKIFLVKILSVDSSWRGKGIAKELMERSREIAREIGVSLMRVDCTSNFSARATARLGFDCIYTLKYSDYQEKGKPVFVPEHPHREVRVYVQRVLPPSQL